MIEKIIEISKNTASDDEVELSWFDMQKPNLSAISKKGKSFIFKVKFTHLHENDVLICQSKYKIKVKKAKDEIYILEFTNVLSFAKAAYEIGNRHMPIQIQDLKIIVLDDIAVHDIIKKLENDTKVSINKTQDYFIANGKAQHVH